MIMKLIGQQLLFLQHTNYYFKKEITCIKKDNRTFIVK